ncbi:hypothetical protein LCGC14_1032290 [marine sediment metagenome]|uniref:Uncharacterized protein n=1 Tax=marine sediment metagenome TaxID=412755 RepID=A0A0F9R083_9ZZZZ
MDYRKLLQSLKLFLIKNEIDIDMGTNQNIPFIMKEVINIIEFHTNLDLYNEFQDLYE